ncbi:hypothetical protein HanHA300_Chr07g0234621 [Helianthus annuus]|nr:hypothetical protein HanHA300_Chr07g0234621 [Helianthus annuus]KAJ0562472.1 hypothetical protein HanHA89_Chr07g0251811 [Helianthus annuus]KAJ0727847.1 hypothetical protein HanLR1_Chr07g0234571 [Helianthus annuus]
MQTKEFDPGTIGRVLVEQLYRPQVCHRCFCHRWPWYDREQRKLIAGFNSRSWAGKQPKLGREEKKRLDEETGWYDGQIWVKTAEVLARDRLLGSFTVKPVLNRLKNTLVGLALSLLLFIALLVNTESTQKETYITSGSETGGRSVAGSYNDESARSFEPEAFCGGSESDLSLND